MLEELAPSILSKYQLEYKKIRPSQSGYRNTSFPLELNGGQMANLILYKNEPDMEARIKRANYVSNFLAAQGFPVRRTLDPRIICLKSPERVIYGSLYNYLPGHTIAWEAYTKDHLKLLGKAMSNVHDAFAKAEPIDTSVTDEYRIILKRMRKYFATKPIQKATLQKLGTLVEDKTLQNLENLLRLTSRLPHQQNLHMDFVRSNLLFSSSKSDNQFSVGKVEITGIIDFEKTAFGSPLFDIARTLAFLLVDCRYKNEQKIRKYFLLSGYHKRGSAEFKKIVVKHDGKSLDVLEALINLFLLYDFYKFLKHNPYEFLEQNQHYVRTRDILLRRDMLKYSN